MAIQSINEKLIKDLFLKIADNVCDLEEVFTEDYYPLLSKEDVDFLSKHQELNDYNTKQKMIIYHTTIMYLATEALLSVMHRKNIVINNEMMFKVCPSYHMTYDQTISDYCQKAFQDIDWIGIEEILISSLTDYVNLLSRKSSGTEITPRSVVEFMLDTSGYYGDDILNTKLLEPACGTGMFLSSIIKRILSRFNEQDKDVIKEMLISKHNLVAYDINPLNIYISKVVILLNLINCIENLNSEDIISLMNGMPFYASDILRAGISDFDYVIGNPPYIRLQNLSLETREYIKANYESTTGRFDIYVCFIEAAIKALKNGGKISFITSNKYFTANYGLGIRKFISNNLNVDFLLDLADTKYFKAAVLPAIIVGHRKDNPTNDKIPFCHLKIDTVERNDRRSIEDIFGYIKDIIEVGENHKNYYLISNHRENIPIEFVFSKVALPESGKQWNFTSGNDSLIKGKIESVGALTLDKLFDICVGIKTTADDVFVKPMTKSFVAEHQLENELIYPIIQSFNIEKWFINWSDSNKKDRYILYPHVESSGKTVAADLSQYPNCAKYLNDNRDKLESRTYLAESKTRVWYECWVPQTLDKFKKVKIVTRDIVSHNSFALDLNGNHCQGNTFFLNLKDTALDKLNFDRSERDFLYYLLGLLNSNVLEYYQKLISGSLYSKKFRYTTTNLTRWPIPRAPQTSINRIVELVDIIIKEGKSNAEIEGQLNNIVYSIYELGENEIKEIELFLKSNT